MLIKSLIGTSASSLVVIAATFLSGVLIARALGPDARGVYGGILLVVQTLVTLVSLSVHDGLTIGRRKGINAFCASLQTNVLTMLGTVFVVTLLISPFFPFFSIYANSSSTFFFVAFTLAFLCLNAVSVGFVSFERGNMRFRFTNISRIFAPILFSLTLLLAMIFEFSPLTAEHILTLFLVTKLPMICIWAWMFRSKFFGGFDLQLSRFAILTGIRLHPAVVIGVLAASFDRLIAVPMWDATTLGLYFVAYSSVAAVFGIIVTAVRAVLLPFFSGLSTTDRALQIAVVFRITILLSAFVGVIGYILLPFFIPFIYGPEYSGAVEYAVLLLAALALTPTHAVVLEANRSLGRGWPSVEMACVSLCTMVLGYLVLGFEIPWQVIISLIIANLFSLLIGCRHLIANGDLKLDRTLLPVLSDLRIITSALRKALSR